MLATFVNKLDAHGVVLTDAERIYYKHAFRCPVEMWFERDSANERGWILQFKAPSTLILNEFKDSLFKQAIGYIEARTRKRVSDISFDDIVSMCGAVEIKAYARA